MRVARDVGGSDLGTVLRALSELRAGAHTRSEVETRQGWVVNPSDAWVASLCQAHNATRVAVVELDG